MADLTKKGAKAVEKKAIALQTLAIEYLDIGAVTPNDYNPNRQSDHDFELLKRSMHEDGFTQPIIVLRTPDATGRHIIVDGEHRWRAARDLGVSRIPVAMVDMTVEQAKIATLRHNRARGSEDLELSAAVLRDLQALGALDWAADSLMLSDAELERLLEDIPAPEALASEEFGQAWEPKKHYDEAETSAETGNFEAGSRTSMSPEASDRVRAMEKRVAEAKTQEEKSQARRDLNVYRLVLLFSGEEAETVKAVLGDTPAPAILQLCKDELARRG